MTRFHCPGCNQVVAVDPHNTDYVHRCESGNPVFDQEDVPILGVARDNNGNIIFNEVGPSEQMFLGVVNTSWGSVAETFGADVDPVTRRGARKSTHFQRQSFAYKDLSTQK